MLRTITVYRRHAERAAAHPRPPLLSKVGDSKCPHGHVAGGAGAVEVGARAGSTAIASRRRSRQAVSLHERRVRRDPPPTNGLDKRLVGSVRARATGPAI